MEGETRNIPLELADIRPDEVHSMREWATLLGLGEANVRTAVREKKLAGTLAPMKNKEGEAISGARWEMTGQQILDWRNNIGTRSSANTMKVKDTVSGRVKVKKDILAEVNLYLAAKYPDVQITLPKPKASKTDAVPADGAANTETTIDLTPAPVEEVKLVKEEKKPRGLFG